MFIDMVSHQFALRFLLCCYLGQYSLHWFCLNQWSLLSYRVILRLVQQFLKFGEGVVIYHFNNMMEAVDSLQKWHQHLKCCVHCCRFVIVNKCVHYFSLFYSWKILALRLARIVNLIFVKSYTNCRLHCLYIVCHFEVFLCNVKKAVLSIVFVFTVVRIHKNSSSLTGVFFPKEQFQFNLDTVHSASDQCFVTDQLGK